MRWIATVKGSCCGFGARSSQVVMRNIELTSDLLNIVGSSLLSCDEYLVSL